jgi:twitching motility protein PilT
MLIESCLHKCEEMKASDVHITSGQSIVYRVKGGLELSEKVSSEEQIEAMVKKLLSYEQQQKLKDKRSIDIGYSLVGNVRFRMNIYYQQGQLAIAARRLDNTILSLEELGLPQQLAKLPFYKDGLVLITGPTGSGKSTTLACLINMINQNRPCHILTIEDPIEYVHTNKKSMIHQREIGSDVNSFSDAIHAAMREDPDVILLGEMRNTDTMHAALMAAETGHLVFSTLHTNDAVGVIDRLVGAFSGEEQEGIRAQLSQVLRAVVTQVLVKNEQGNARIPVNEVLIITPAIANLIRQHKPEQIRSMMETGRALGNQTLEQCLAVLVIDKKISKEQALALTYKPDALEQTLRALRSNMGGRVKSIV